MWSAAVFGDGVAGPQDPGERFAGGVEERQQRMEPEGVLVVRCCPFLVGVRDDERGVEVDHVEAGVLARSPRPGAGRGSGVGDPLERSCVDGFECAPRRRRRRHLPEQIGLVAQHSQLGDRLAAIGDRHRQIVQHLAAVMPAAALLGRRHRRRQALGQADRVGEIRQQPSADMVGDVPAVTGHRQTRTRRVSSPRKCPPGLGSCCLRQAQFPKPGGRFHGRAELSPEELLKGPS